MAERDIYLSLTMKSSMAVNGCRRVVGVVGRGHMRGVLARLSQNHAGKFKELTWTPTRAAAKEKVWGAFVRVTRVVLAQGFDCDVSRRLSGRMCSGGAVWWCRGSVTTYLCLYQHLHLHLYLCLYL